MDPYSCADCGIRSDHHGHRYTSSAGVHGWIRPGDEQVKARMVENRRVRLLRKRLWAEIALRATKEDEK